MGWLGLVAKHVIENVLITVSRTRYNAVNRKVAGLGYGQIPALGTNLLHRSHHQLLHSCCVGGENLNKTQFYNIPVYYIEYFWIRSWEWAQWGTPLRSFF